MQIILREEVPSLGTIGDVVKVKPGYARNYLLPRGLAIEASGRNLKELEHQKRVVADRRLRVQKTAGAAADKLATVTLAFTLRAGEDGKLFGSVTSKDIEEGLAAQGVMIDRKKIQLTQPIKALGAVTVPIKLHRDVTATVSVEVVKLQEEETASHDASETHETHEKPEKKPKSEKKEKKARGE